MLESRKTTVIALLTCREFSVNGSPTVLSIRPPVILECMLSLVDGTPAAADAADDGYVRPNKLRPPCASVDMSRDCVS
jgi:hypothetical protein